MQAGRIVNFPVERARVPMPQTRLLRALDRVDAALSEQAAAVAAWRAALGGLGAATAQLETNLRRYDATLDALSDGTRTLQLQAGRLLDVVA